MPLDTIFRQSIFTLPDSQRQISEDPDEEKLSKGELASIIS